MTDDEFDQFIEQIHADLQKDIDLWWEQILQRPIWNPAAEAELLTKYSRSMRKQTQK